MAQRRENSLPATALRFAIVLSLSANLHPALADYQNPAFNKGKQKMAAGDFDGAVNSFGEAIGMNDTEPKGYLMRGQCFFKLQNYKLAIQDMDKALQLAPNKVRALLVRGSCKANLGQDDEAVADYMAAIKLEPDLGTRYFKNGGQNVEARPRGKQKSADSTDGHADLRLHAIEDYKKAMNIVYPRGLELADDSGKHSANSN